MIQWSQAWQRLKRLDAFKGMGEQDFRPLSLVQTFTPASGGVATAFAGRTFPNGAVILGITSAAFIPTVAGTAQGNKSRQLYQIDFAYTGGENLVIDGPVLADALLGSGELDLFPARELIIAPNQQIQCRVANITTGSLTVQVVYHAMVYRFAS